MSLAYYQEKLSSLNVDRSSGHPKPHKICLLFAVIDLIDKGSITQNRIELNDDLKSAFTFHFEKLKKGNDANNINQPFYHLLSEGFWHFKLKPNATQGLEQLKAAGRTPSENQLKNLIEYAYLDQELFDYLKSKQTKPVLKEALLENLEDLSVQFHRWILSVGKSEKTAKNYVGAIKSTLSNWASDADISQQNLISIQSYSKIHGIAEELGQYEVFQTKNAKGGQMYSAALNSYKEFLADTCQTQVNEDIAQIINDDTIDNTQKTTLVNTRVGQGKFREKLIKYWKGCALTGYPSTQFLVASHIKPWRAANDQERLDTYNGILLLPNLDKAFDLGYISFTEKGQIQVSEFVEAPHNLGIQQTMQINLVSQHQDYLAYHREEIFRN